MARHTVDLPVANWTRSLPLNGLSIRMHLVSGPMPTRGPLTFLWGQGYPAAGPVMGSTSNYPRP